MRRPLLALLLSAPLLLLGSGALAHYPMLESDVAVATVGERVTVEIGVGHPFGNDRYVLAKPVGVVLRHPDGESTSLWGDLEQVGTPMLPRWRIRFEAEEEGDHVLVVRTHFSEPPERKLEDHAKLYLHVRGGPHGLQLGWEEPIGTAEKPEPIEIVPLTRPYGIPVGTTFRGQVLEDGQPYAGAAVEAETYPGPEGVREPFPDQWEYRRYERTDAAGQFAITFDRPGWWMLSCASDGTPGPKLQTRGIVQRSVVWLWVGAWDRTRRRVFLGAGEAITPPPAPPPAAEKKEVVPPPAAPPAEPPPPTAPVARPPVQPPALGPGLAAWAVLLALGITLLRAMRPAAAAVETPAPARC